MDSARKDAVEDTEPKKAPKDAFAALMAPKPKPQPQPPKTSPTASKSKDGLGPYLHHPESFPPTRVIYHNPNFVAIHDLYPKSTVHALLLPRSPQHTLQHPFDAFRDPDFLAAVKAEVENLRVLVARELQRRLGAGSRSEARREAVLAGEVELADGEDLPAGRDWAAEVVAGIHAHPSMSHLHVHVLSREMHSPCLKHRKHYNSFNTPFLIDVAEFPLADDDPRLHPGKEGYLKQDFKCWRCGRNFKNQFKALKDHLEVEFEEWRKE